MTDNTSGQQLATTRGFKKGISGNPNGRPKGSKNKITLMKLALEGELRAQLKHDAQEILKVAINAAKSGDTAMLKLLIDKMIPTSRAMEDEAPTQDKINIAITRLPPEEKLIVNNKVIEHE